MYAVCPVQSLRLREWEGVFKKMAKDRAHHNRHGMIRSGSTWKRSIWRNRVRALGNLASPRRNRQTEKCLIGVRCAFFLEAPSCQLAKANVLVKLCAFYQAESIQSVRVTADTDSIWNVLNMIRWKKQRRESEPGKEGSTQPSIVAKRNEVSSF